MCRFSCPVGAIVPLAHIVSCSDLLSAPTRPWERWCMRITVIVAYVYSGEFISALRLVSSLVTLGLPCGAMPQLERNLSVVSSTRLAICGCTQLRLQRWRALLGAQRLSWCRCLHHGFGGRFCGLCSCGVLCLHMLTISMVRADKGKREYHRQLGSGVRPSLPQDKIGSNKMAPPGS